MRRARRMGMVLLAALTLFGLLDALQVDGDAARLVAWIALAAPLVVAARVMLKG